MIKRLLLFGFSLICVLFTFAQVTTGTITGTVKDSKGQILSGATIKAVLTTTGSVYNTTSNSSGAYTLPNMRVGGPYTLTVNYVGHNQATIDNLTITLGNTLQIDPSLDITGQTLTEVQVTGARKGAIISSVRNGASLNISSKQMVELPTINRSITDFARLMPQANNIASTNGSSYGVSFGGQSNRYNQFSIDGINSTDGFGLTSSGTNGGQANLNPIPLEAIQEMQIALSPYDITQGGFTGGGMNAITRSGTNTFHGSAYGFGQTQALIGKSVLNNTSYPTYKNYTWGASLGGAIIKNKLFFYVNYERYDKSSPLAYDPTVSGSGSKFDPNVLQGIESYVTKTYGYDPGGFGNITPKNYSNSVFGRIDWNISSKSKLTVRELYVDGSNNLISRSPTSITFSNGSYRFASTTHSLVAELNTNLSSRASNVLRVTYTSVFDRRVTPSFPALTIMENGLTYNVGSDNSSQVNSLKQKTFTLTDNFTLYRGEHTITFGTNNEFYNTKNAFLQNYYGNYTYGTSAAASGASIAAFEANSAPPTSFSSSYVTPQASDAFATAQMHAAQLGVYGQDVYKITPTFKLTYGLRLDMPIFFNHPPANSQFNSDPTFAQYNVATDKMPKAQIVASPRVGFNWDVKGDATTQLRGGAGIFLGRAPFVWLSNQYSNTGVTNIAYSPTASQMTSAGIRFKYDPKDQHLGAYIPATSSNTATTINVVDRNFKLPRTFRANLAIDQKLPWWGLIGTIEAIYTKVLYDINYQNLNLPANTDSLVHLGPTTRPNWFLHRVTNSYTDVLELINTKQGYSYNFTAQLSKPLSHGWSGMIAYTYGHSTSLSDGTSSVALSNWRFAYSTYGLNNLSLARNNFDLGSRVIGTVTKSFQYAHGHLGTTITLVYNGQSGQPFSYLYSKGVMGDDVTAGNGGQSNTIVYLPATQADANFADIKNSNGTVKTTAAQQWTDYMGFVQSNKYLSKHLGQNTVRNGDRMPWENHFDLRIAENVFITGTHRLDITLDMLNVGNLFDRSGGWNYTLSNQSVNLFQVVSNPGVATPQMQFDITRMNSIHGVYRPYAISDFTSRWRGQIGLRYSF